MIETMKGGRREVTLPAGTLLEVLGLARAAGEETLRDKGVAAGRLLAERLASAQDAAGSARALPLTIFWKRVGEIFASRGWGTLDHADDGAGVGELRSADWIEADRPAGRDSCAFGAGMIQGLLEGVSGARLAVEEVACRANGAAGCRFLFGSAAAVARAGNSARAASGAA